MHPAGVRPDTLLVLGVLPRFPEYALESPYWDICIGKSAYSLDEQSMSACVLA